MKNREFIQKNVLYNAKCMCERWETIQTKFGDGFVERFWLLKNIKVAGKTSEELELLGYKCTLQKGIYGDICIKPGDAVRSAEFMYEEMLEKAIKVLDKK